MDASGFNMHLTVQENEPPSPRESKSTWPLSYSCNSGGTGQLCPDWGLYLICRNIHLGLHFKSVYIGWWISPSLHIRVGSLISVSPAITTPPSIFNCVSCYTDRRPQMPKSRHYHTKLPRIRCRDESNGSIR